MNYQEARKYIEQAHIYGSVLGLDNIRELLRRLQNPQDKLAFIHLAGTNGKGSVMAFLSTILQESGYVVGRYISPAVFSYRECIQVNQENIEKDVFARLLTQIAEVVFQMQKDGFMHPTVFEMETVLGFLYFAERQCDLVVLETGLGGTLDATNVVTNTMMAIITPIAMDHMQFLGNSLSEIARNKAGIIKPKSKVVSAPQQAAALTVLKQTCKEQQSTLTIVNHEDIYDIVYGYEEQRFSYKAGKDLKISLAGVHQIENAALAVEAVRQLRELNYKIDEKALRLGLAHTVWNGRFTIIRKEPLFIIDGAHNPAAADVLKKSLQMYFTNRRIFYIIGILGDKEYEKIIRLMVPLAHHIITVGTTIGERAFSSEQLERVVKQHHLSVESAKDIETAVAKGLQRAKKDDVIVAFGSLSFLGEVKRLID